MKYGCIGEHLPHSFSKEIHEKIGGYEYVLHEVAREKLEAFFRARDFAAVNVTIPYKQAVLPYLDKIDTQAENIGAVNTVVNKGGVLFGYNTDFYGMRALIRKGGFDLKGAKVLIFGTGGTAKTAKAVAASLGAGSIVYVSRVEKKGAVTYEEAYRCHTDADFLINASPVGMFPCAEGCPIELDGFPCLGGVIDAVYNPLRTRLVLAARARHIAAEGGLYMLAAQAVAAAGIFTEKNYPDTMADDIFSSILREKENVVLTGMPSSGKSTVGKRLAKVLCRPFYDTDEEIVKETGAPIADFFAKHGEGAFRDAETAVIRRLSALHGAVIATGGGAILRDENVRLLRQNGKLCFLDRPLEKLAATADRPLASDKSRIKALYEARLTRYKETCDMAVGVLDDPDEPIGEIARYFS